MQTTGYFLSFPLPWRKKEENCRSCNPWTGTEFAFHEEMHRFSLSGISKPRCCWRGSARPAGFRALHREHRDTSASASCTSECSAPNSSPTTSFSLLQTLHELIPGPFSRCRTSWALSWSSHHSYWRGWLYLSVVKELRNMITLRSGLRKWVWEGEESKCSAAVPGPGVSPGLLQAWQHCASFSKLTSRLWD